ncbi:MAG: glycosyltransferase family A protein [Planctomycetota bacterium]
MESSRPYIVVTPAYNEEEHLPATIESMVAQRVPPAVWVIVDDGSTDRTGEIVRAAAEETDWIVAVGGGDKQTVGSDGLLLALEIKAFERGLERALEISPNAEFYCKLDADLRFDEEYFAKLLEEMAKDERLGIAGGTIYEYHGDELVKELINPKHVRGATKFYRRTCYEAFGGLRSMLGWDVVDELLAHDHDWRVKPFDPPQLIHLRPTSSRGGRFKGFVRNGLIAHYVGYSFGRIAIRSAYRVTLGLDPVHGFGLFWGYFRSVISRRPRADRAVLDSVRRNQWSSAPIGSAIAVALKNLPGRVRGLLFPSRSKSSTSQKPELERVPPDA